MRVSSESHIENLRCAYSHTVDLALRRFWRSRPSVADNLLGCSAACRLPVWHGAKSDKQRQSGVHGSCSSGAVTILVLQRSSLRGACRSSHRLTQRSASLSSASLQGTCLMDASFGYLNEQFFHHRVPDLSASQAGGQAVPWTHDGRGSTLLVGGMIRRPVVFAVCLHGRMHRAWFALDT